MDEKVLELAPFAFSSVFLLHIDVEVVEQNEEVLRDAFRGCVFDFNHRMHNILMGPRFLELLVLLRRPLTIENTIYRVLEMEFLQGNVFFVEGISEKFLC